MNLATRKLTSEALIFMLLGGILLAILATMRGSVYYAPTENRLIGFGVGFASGLVLWVFYRMTRFVITG